MAAQLGIDNVNLLFSHERITFRIRDSGVLRRKFAAYFSGVDAVFARLQAAGRAPVLLQELGGFISVLASYYAARRRGVDNWFLEPAFFRGRLFFLRNSFRALEVAGPIADTIDPNVERYLADTVAQRAIVIPKKDRHQYTSVLTKVANRRNIRRFFEKVYDKHVLRKHQDFQYVGVYVMSHLEMVWNSMRLRRCYTQLDRLGSFIYYPLHVPADMALTLRSPEYLDQLALIDYLCRIAPATHAVCIKEHPAQIGALPASRIRALMRRYDNLVVLPPTTNNYAVLDRASAVVSVNSKSGAEALLVGRPVLMLGDAFYSNSGLATRVGVLRDLRGTLAEALKAPSPNAAQVRGYFQTVFDRSLPGELYVTEPENIAVVAESIRGRLLSPPS